MPGWVSGAPAGARGPDAPPERRRPRRYSPSGSSSTSTRSGRALVATPAKLDRLRRRGKWLDADGHLLLEARYPSAEDAEAGDTEFYARYLLTRGREQLLAGPLPLLLTDDAGEETAGGGACGPHWIPSPTALASISTLRVWRGYAFPRAALAARLASQRRARRRRPQPHLPPPISRAGPVTRRRFAVRDGPRCATQPSARCCARISGAAPQLAGLGYPGRRMPRERGHRRLRAPGSRR